MLPGWIGLFLLGDRDRRADLLSRLLRAIWTAVALTVGLIAVFAAIGIALGAGLGAIRSVLPLAILARGAGLLVLGSLVLGRGELPSVHLRRPAVRRGSDTVARSALALRTGIAAPSCALPVFLISVGPAGARPSATGC